MDPIRLLVSLDQNYIPQLEVLLASVYWNNPGESMEIYLLHSGIPEPALEPVAQLCERMKYSFYQVRVEDALFAGAPIMKQYPKEMYYRLLAARLLPQHLDKILYLDPDILVINPLRPLWETPLENRLFAAAAHIGRAELASNVNRLRLGTKAPYYNSGVLLINLEECRNKISEQKIFNYVEEHKKELVLPDQDVLNALYGDQILPLDDVIWNYDARHYKSYHLASSGKHDTKWVIQNTAILHFCGKAKPWKSGYFYRFGALYLHYAHKASQFFGLKEI